MNTHSPTLLEAGIRAEFLRASAGAEMSDLVSRIATIVQSDKNEEKYAHLGQAPTMSALSGEVMFSGLTDTSYTIANTTYVSGLAVRREDLEDDQISGLRFRVNQLVQAAFQKRNALVIDLLTSNGNGYDATAFFSNSHPARKDEGGTQDNLLAGTGTSATQVADDINSAIAAIAGFKAENGQPFVEMPTQFALVAPFGIRRSVLEALNAGMISQTSNVQTAGIQIDPIFTPRLSDSNDWYLLYTGGAIKPLIFQERVSLGLEAVEEGSESSLRREQYLYKCRARWGAGYGPWQYAAKVVNS